MRVGHTRSATGPSRRTCTHSANSRPVSFPLAPFHSSSLSDRGSTPSRFRRWPIFDYLDACHPTSYCKLIASNWKTFSGYPESPPLPPQPRLLSLSLFSRPFSLSIVNLGISRRRYSSRFHRRLLRFSAHDPLAVTDYRLVSIISDAPHVYPRVRRVTWHTCSLIVQCTS